MPQCLLVPKTEPQPPEDWRRFWEAERAETRGPGGQAGEQSGELQGPARFAGPIAPISWAAGAGWVMSPGRLS